MAVGRVKSTRLPQYLSSITRPEPIEIAARHKLRPYAQGDFSKLCSLFANINGLRLALSAHAPLSNAASSKLFADGIEFLQRKGRLFRAAIEGMGPNLRLSLARYLACRASTSNCLVRIELPNPSIETTEAMFSWITASIAENKPVLIAMLGGLNHQTVVSGITPRLLHLFDSNGHQFAFRSSCGLDANSFHQIPPNGLFRIAVDAVD